VPGVYVQFKVLLRRYDTTHFDDYSNWVGSQQVINERQFAAGDSQRNLHVALRAGTHHVISWLISFCNISERIAGYTVAA